MRRSKRYIMRTALIALLAWFLALPAHAKSKRDVYPISCDVLWTAVKNTLNSTGNYAVLSVNDLAFHASFNVIGNLVKYTDRVTLLEQDGGCRMDLQVLQVGADNSDERGFRKRLKLSLGKLEQALPNPRRDETPAGLLGQQ